MSKPVDRALQQVREDDDKPMEVELHEERTDLPRTKFFARMRTDWDGPNGEIVAHVVGSADNLVLQAFPGAYAVMSELWEIVREPEIDPLTGEVLKDAYGFTFWKKTASGNFIEDYSKLTHSQRANLIFEITTNIFEWEQKAAEMWGEAQFSKAMFEERFAERFGAAPGTRPTVDDRTQFARAESSDERYFAIFKSLVSRKADGLLSSLKLIGQRLKDMTA